tara:strand:+ start:618 stop:1049 length:432 start_codon:yes stop_codon:yes gene_type:complete
MEIEFFNVHNNEGKEKYYPIVSKWWEEWKWPSISPEFLSTTGAIIKHEDEYICAAWLYQTDSLMCVVDFFISVKKKFSGNLKKDSLKLLINKLEELAQSNGFKAVYTSVKSQPLINLLLELDYGKDSATEKGDINMTVFIKLI